MLPFYACHGLGVIQPVDDLANYIANQTGMPVVTVGDADPQLQQFTIIARIRGDGAHSKRGIFIGHSKGAMLGYYLPQDNLDLRAWLIITIDPTCWGSNINAQQWSLWPEYPGKWQASVAAQWINFSSGTYPGGGKMINANGQNWQQFTFSDTDHMGIVNDARTRKICLDAVRKYQEGSAQ